MKLKGRSQLAIVAVAVLVGWGVLLCPMPAAALSTADIIRLKEAGMSDATISEIDRSHAIYRAIFTLDELVDLKSAKFSDKFILQKIRDTGPTIYEMDAEADKDRALARRLARTRQELDVAADYLSKLIANPEVVKLVKSGKVSGADYANIVKYLKQFVREEESVDHLEKHISDHTDNPSAPVIPPANVVIYKPETP